MAWYHEYGTFYKGEFDSIPREGGQSDSYFFYIKKKNYVPSGKPIPPPPPFPIISVACSGNPAIHTWLNEEPKPYINGSELKINLLNINNQLPLSKFYSEYDDEWLLEFYCKVFDGTNYINQLLFSGYLVQEDCQELVVDYTHEIQLSFTDNLGLLKNIKFLDAIKQTPRKGLDIYSVNTSIKTNIDFEGLKYIDLFGTSYQLEIGDSIIIENNNAGNGIYTVDKFVINGTHTYVYTSDDLNDITQSGALVRVIKPYKQNDIINLIDLYWIIIYNTGQKLPLFNKCELEELTENQVVDKRRLLDYIGIDISSFIDKENSDTLDDILSKINYRFSFTLFQSYGYWCLIRFLDIENNLEGFKYDIKLNFVSGPENLFSYLDFKNHIGNGIDIENGLNQSIYRPLQFARHTFDFELPELLYNSDLQILGNKLAININDQSKAYYTAEGWQKSLDNLIITNKPDRYIQIEYDQFNIETDRFLIVKDSGGINAWAANSIPIKLCKDDIIKINYDYKTFVNYNYYGFTYSCFLIQQDPDNNTYLSLSYNDSGNWQLTPFNGLKQQMVKDEWDKWQTFTLTSKPVPYDCYGFLCLNNLQNAPMAYKNITIEIVRTAVSGSNVYKGNIHKTTIQKQIKNNIDEKIYLDDTQKWNMKGTLFLPQYIGGKIRKRTLGWGLYPYTITKPLGEIILRQEHIWRKKISLKLEGNLFPIIKNSVLSSNKVILSPLNKLYFLPFDPQSGIEMIFGKLEINYKENKSNFTAYQLYFGIGNVYEEPTDIIYTFKYLT